MNRFERGVRSPIAFNRAFVCERLRFLVPTPDVERPSLFFDWEWQGIRTVIMVAMERGYITPCYVKAPEGLDVSGQKVLENDAAHLADWLKEEI
jgi:hypothetical protein